MKPSRVLTRQQLYELVWTKPIGPLAQDFAVSEDDLVEICSRHAIPVPPRGYWPQLRAGRRVIRYRLPTAAHGARDGVEIRSIAAAKVPEETAFERDRDADVTNAGIRSLPHDRDLHSMVATWIKDHADRVAWVRSESCGARFGTGFDDASAPDLTEKDWYRLEATSTFLKAIEEAGVKVLRGWIAGRLELEVSGTRLHVAIVQKMQQKLRPTAEDKNWTAFRSHHNVGLFPTPWLRITVGAALGGRKKLEWIESEERKAATLLPEIVERILATATMPAAQASAAETCLRAVEDLGMVEGELDRLKRRDSVRWQRFRLQAGYWEECTRLRTFLEALKHQAANDGMELDDRSLADWIAWAEGQIAALNPLARGGLAVFDAEGRGPAEDA